MPDTRYRFQPRPCFSEHGDFEGWGLVDVLDPHWLSRRELDVLADELAALPPLSPSWSEASYVATWGDREQAARMGDALGLLDPEEACRG